MNRVERRRFERERLKRAKASELRGRVDSVGDSNGFSVSVEYSDSLIGDEVEFDDGCSVKE